MHSAFWFGFEINDFLFKGLNVHSSLGMACLCFVIILATIGFEGLKVIHAEAKIKSVLLNCQERPRLFSSQDSTTLLGNVSPYFRRQRAICYFLDISLYVVQVILGYLLMLSVMTFNGYVSLAILFGVFVGYAVFGQRLVERRIKTTQLSIPCHKCLQSEEEKADTEVTDIGDGPSGCCSKNSENETLQEIQA